MKNSFFVLLAAGLILTAANLFPLELQLGYYPELGIGAYMHDKENTVSFSYNNTDFKMALDAATTFSLLGFSINARLFSPNQPGLFDSGPVLNLKLARAMSSKMKGTAYVYDANGNLIAAEPVNVKNDDDSKSDIMIDAALGLSSRLVFKNSVGFYLESLVDFKFMNTDEGKDTYDYFGVGLCMNLAFQFNVTRNFYIEPGFNCKTVLFSSTKAKVKSPFDDDYITWKYKSGFDFVTASIAVGFGWRFM